MRSARALTALLASAAVVTGLAGCAPGSASSSGPAQEASKDFGTEDIQLTIVSASLAPMEALAAEFETLHPNVSIDVQAASFNDYNKGLALQLASKSAPDIAQLALVGNLAKDHLILPLDEYADLYGWNDSFASTQLASWKVKDDLLGLGGTNLIALPTTSTIVGVYYNKALAEQAGISAPPATFDEFEDDLAKAKEAGLLPFQLSDAEGHVTFNIQTIGQSIDGAADSIKWALGETGSTFVTDGNLKAAETLLDWSEKGYLPSTDQIIGMTLTDSVSKFTAGESVFLIDGTWDAGAISGAMGDNVGFFLLPGIEHTTAIGGSIGYAISGNTKYPNAAAAFLDFVQSPEGGAVLIEAGDLPANVADVEGKAGVQSDMIAGFRALNEANQLSDEDGLVPYYDAATPTMLDTDRQGTQALLAGRLTPEQYLQSMQEDWAKVHKE